MPIKPLERRNCCRALFCHASPAKFLDGLPTVVLRPQCTLDAVGRSRASGALGDRVQRCCHRSLARSHTPRAICACIQYPHRMACAGRVGAQLTLCDLAQCSDSASQVNRAAGRPGRADLGHQRPREERTLSVGSSARMLAVHASSWLCELSMPTFCACTVFAGRRLVQPCRPHPRPGSSGRA